MMLTAQLAGLTETLVNAAEPWSKAYSHSKVLSAGVTFFHVAPLIFGAGAAFMMDRATLRAFSQGAEERMRHLRELGLIHTLVLFGLALSFISGVLMFLADVETFIGSIYFWVKLALVALLLLNGFVMTRAEKALSRSSGDMRLWGRLRMLSIISATLWLATTLAGVVLKEYA